MMKEDEQNIEIKIFKFRINYGFNKIEINKIAKY
jgi:hypothetical protein